MKKSLVALAVLAGFAGAAAAQSSVTLFGVIDVAARYTKANGQNVKQLTNDGSSSSRFGVRGVEDLGGGLKAGFQIETGFNPATGAAAGTFWGRQSEVNLSGSFGMIRLGNFTSEAYFATADYVSMHNHDTGVSEDKLYGANVGSSNKVAYRTPAFSGLVAELAVREGNVGGGERGYDLAVNYDAGALHLGLGADKLGDAKQFALRGLYELGAVTVGGYFQHDTDAAGDSRNNFRLAGMYAMGATELHLNVGKAGERASANDGATQLTLGANYNLSKLTSVTFDYQNYKKAFADANNSSMAEIYLTKAF